MSEQENEKKERKKEIRYIRRTDNMYGGYKVNHSVESHKNLRSFKKLTRVSLFFFICDQRHKNFLKKK